MTVKELKDLSKESCISLDMAKDETVDMLDTLEPEVNHSNLKRKELACIPSWNSIVNRFWKSTIKQLL